MATSNGEQTSLTSPNGCAHQAETAIDGLGGEVTTSTAPIDLHVRELNYTVTDKPGRWWQRITHFQNHKPRCYNYWGLGMIRAATRLLTSPSETSMTGRV
ncbi:hypothetical protein PoB_003033700 [Plakobranchus ocellatus]|uniref:Uncharacterized protein n=1 Tax=Plakobranchus ocellatus TaxID=259542 RepID=A0AAV4A9D8_9GAST|nr:hypothetical protein PoB_003033700 [Plakobranchus ocellatus]